MKTAYLCKHCNTIFFHEKGSEAVCTKCGLPLADTKIRATDWVELRPEQKQYVIGGGNIPLKESKYDPNEEITSAFEEAKAAASAAEKTPAPATKKTPATTPEKLIMDEHYVNYELSKDEHTEALLKGMAEDIRSIKKGVTFFVVLTIIGFAISILFACGAFH